MIVLALEMMMVMMLIAIREAVIREKCSFFNIVQTGGGGVKPMFKNYVVNFV